MKTGATSPSSESPNVERMLDRMRAAWVSSGKGVESEREAFRTLSSHFPAPSAVSECWITLGGVPVLGTTPDGFDDANGTALLYFHGGAFLIGSAEIYRYQSSKLAVAAAARVLTVDYRLAPEYRFPAALDDAYRAYEGLIGTGIDPGRVVLAGDSAGGNIAVATAIRLRDAGQPPPGGIVAISPWVDLSCSGDSMETNANPRHLAQHQGLTRSAATYLDGHDARSPDASPLFADLNGLPPTLIQVGSLETLLDESLELERRMAEAGSKVQLTIYSGMVHEWHLLSALLEPDYTLEGAERAISEIADFCRGVGTT